MKENLCQIALAVLRRDFHNRKQNFEAVTFYVSYQKIQLKKGIKIFHFIPLYSIWILNKKNLTTLETPIETIIRSYESWK